MCAFLLSFGLQSTNVCTMNDYVHTYQSSSTYQKVALGLGVVGLTSLALYKLYHRCFSYCNPKHIDLQKSFLRKNIPVQYRKGDDGERVTNTDYVYACYLDQNGYVYEGTSETAIASCNIRPSQDSYEITVNEGNCYLKGLVQFCQLPNIVDLSIGKGVNATIDNVSRKGSTFSVYANGTNDLTVSNAHLNHLNIAFNEFINTDNAVLQPDQLDVNESKVTLENSTAKKVNVTINKNQKVQLNLGGVRVNNKEDFNIIVKNAIADIKECSGLREEYSLEEHGNSVVTYSWKIQE